MLELIPYKIQENIYMDWTLLFVGLGFFLVCCKFCFSMSEREWQRRMDEKREFGIVDITPEDKPGRSKLKALTSKK